LLNIQRRGFTTGAGHILDDIIDRAGGQNMGRMVGDAMVAVSLEHVLMLRPEYLILIGTPGTPPEAVDRGTEFLAHPVLRQHFPPRRRIILPASLVQCAGASTPLAVSALQAALADQRGVSSPR
jgi:iron complex transport system substrate-binding protein